MYGNSGYTGYNQADIQKLYQGLRDSYEALIANVGNTLQSEVLDPIGSFWYAVEAQKTGDSIVGVINGDFSKSIQKTYSEYTGYLEGVAKTWAEFTQNEAIPNNVGNSTAFFDVNREAIKEDYNDEFVGIDEVKAEEYVNNISNVKQRIADVIDETYVEIRKLNPFVGEAQEQATQQLIGKLQASVTDMFNFIIDGTGNFSSSDGEFKGIKDAMSGWAEEYKERARRAKEAMSN